MHGQLLPCVEGCRRIDTLECPDMNHDMWTFGDLNSAISRLLLHHPYLYNGDIATPNPESRGKPK